MTVRDQRPHQLKVSNLLSDLNCFISINVSQNHYKHQLIVTSFIYYTGKHQCHQQLETCTQFKLF